MRKSKRTLRQKFPNPAPLRWLLGAPEALVRAVKDDYHRTHPRADRNHPRYVERLHGHYEANRARLDAEVAGRTSDARTRQAGLPFTTGEA